MMRAGVPFETCARAAGVKLADAQRWYLAGGQRDADEALVEFRREIDRADAEVEARNVAIVQTAARESWQAAAWWLERALPERWARASQRERAAEAKEAAQAHDPFGEVDELAQRRR